MYISILAWVAGVLGKARLTPSVSREMQANGMLDVMIQLQPASNDDVAGDSLAMYLMDHAKKSQAGMLAALRQMKGVERVQPYYISNTVAVRGTAKVVRWLAAQQGVEEISSNRPFQNRMDVFNEKDALMAQNVPWTGTSSHWSLEFINATGIPDSVRVRASKLIYANADTGVEFTHPALQENYMGTREFGIDHNYAWWDANKVANASKPNKACGVNSSTPCDDNNHGTHTMSTVVGKMGLGVSPTSKWIACKNMDMNLGSPETYLGCLQFFLAPTRIDGTEPMPERRPHVVGNSYGCPPEEGCSPTTFRYALQALRSAGILMIVSAGNDGSKGCSSVISPPATDPGSFNVAASRYKSFGRAGFSSMGPVSSRTLAIDITAPGVNITGAVRGGRYDQYQGTSMAAPHVAGAALLIMAACPHLLRQVDAITDLLRTTATPNLSTMLCGGESKDATPNNEYGYGALNVARAIATCHPITKSTIP
ncbi:hypothetical protein DSO57_1038719 [Entomophthora muscae]|uniref:Uncharacterized protein n=1 Tax=Entomophthora muscae TaxID=34485 RepID=A0ACC2S0V4_9FUNG|nr:hypothetical protein DSO57_1038719 [Entomophthora muscae]